jgi:nucleoside phosphorylase
MRIIIFAALPEEYRSFQKQIGKWRQLARQPVRLFRNRNTDREILLVETGMGRKQLNQAFAAALQAGPGPADLILSTGFAGSLWKGFAVGQVLLGERFAFCNQASPPHIAAAFRLHPPPALVSFCSAHHVETARMITVPHPRDKSQLSCHAGSMPSAMDMESTHLARLAFHNSIPFLALRAISDALADVIDYSLEEITDANGRVRIPRVLLAILKKPLLCRSFAGSWRRARKAALQLARTLTALLELPDPVLRSLVRECRLLPVPGQHIGANLVSGIPPFCKGGQGGFERNHWKSP